MNKKRLKIKKDLINDKISYSEAFNLLKALPKLWHTKEWNEKRKKLIKDNCEQCGIGKEDSPMYIQHLVHPPKFSNIRNALFAQKFKRYIENNNIDFKNSPITDEEYEKYLKENIEIRKICPNCKKQSISFRKTMTPKYRCSGCRHEFNEPEEIEYIPDLKIRPTDEDIRKILDYNNSRSSYYALRQELYLRWQNEIGKAALIISMEQSEKYGTLKDTVTFCKKCATYMDMRNRLLCYSCKKYYFNFRLYSVCYHCHIEKKTTSNPYSDIVLNGEFEEFNLSSLEL